MTTVPPPINPALPRMLAAATATQPTGTIAAPPAVLAALATGTVLQGVVTQTPDPRVVLLSTAAGDVPLRTSAPLPDGATVTLEIVRATPAQISVKLVAIDGTPVALQLAPQPQLTAEEAAPPSAPTSLPLPSAPGTPQPLPPGFAWWPGGAQQITALPVLSGFVIAATPTPATPTQPLVPLQPAQPPVTAVATGPQFVIGADVALRVVAVTLPTAPAATVAPASIPAALPAATPLPQPATPTPNTPIPAAIPTPAPTVVAATPPSAAVSQTPVTIADLIAGAARVADPDTAPGLVLPKSDGWSAPAPQPPVTVHPAPPLAQITGTVIALKDGVPVLKLGESEVQLNARANLPVGSTVTVEVRAIQPPLMPLPLAPTPPPALMPLSLAQPSWPTLSESLALLQRADPVAAQQLANAIPDGGPRTAAAVMSFVQAMRTGESRQWPGDAALRALERASPRGAHLAAQLAAEVEDLSRPVRDTAGEWRSLALPWHGDGRVDRIRMVFRELDADAEAEKRKAGGGVRFLVDLDLSRLGPLQLDGIFRKAPARQLDLMIRTKAQLADTLRQELAGLFAQSNAAMGLAGSLTFQVTPRFPDPLTRTPTGDKSGLWV